MSLIALLLYFEEFCGRKSPCSTYKDILAIESILSLIDLGEERIDNPKLTKKPPMRRFDVFTAIT